MNALKFWSCLLDSSMLQSFCNHAWIEYLLSNSKVLCWCSWWYFVYSKTWEEHLKHLNIKKKLRSLSKKLFEMGTIRYSSNPFASLIVSVIMLQQSFFAKLFECEFNCVIVTHDFSFEDALQFSMETKNGYLTICWLVLFSDFIHLLSRSSQITLHRNRFKRGLHASKPNH